MPKGKKELARKRCPGCNKEKVRSKTYFYRDESDPDGYRPLCIKCDDTLREKKENTVGEFYNGENDEFIGERTAKKEEKKPTDVIGEVLEPHQVAEVHKKFNDLPVATLAKMLSSTSTKQIIATAPDLAEVYRHTVHCFGGAEGVAQMIWGCFALARTNREKIRILEMLVRMSTKVSEMGRSDVPLDELTDEQLAMRQEQYERLMENYRRKGKVIDVETETPPTGHIGNGVQSS